MSTLYERAAIQAGSAVDRARQRKPNNEKPAKLDPIEELEVPPELERDAADSSDYPNEDTSLPGSLGKLACELRNAIGIMSESEMAAILQVSHETLATWRTKKRGPPHVKIGKRAFYLVADFTQWVAGEVERQGSLNAAGRKHHRKGARTEQGNAPRSENHKEGKHQSKSEPREEREEHVCEVEAQV